MRFEQSYLASIRGFVHEVDEQTAEETKEDRLDDHGDHKSGEKAHRVMASRSPTGEPELWMGRLRVQWCVSWGQSARRRSTPLNSCTALPRWPLVYLTVRDQMLSPILQGAVFGIGGLALGHVRTFLQARRQARANAR